MQVAGLIVLSHDLPNQSVFRCFATAPADFSSFFLGRAANGSFAAMGDTVQMGAVHMRSKQACHQYNQLLFSLSAFNHLLYNRPFPCPRTLPGTLRTQPSQWGSRALLMTATRRCRPGCSNAKLQLCWMTLTKSRRSAHSIVLHVNMSLWSARLQSRQGHHVAGRLRHRAAHLRQRGCRLLPTP